MSLRWLLPVICVSAAWAQPSPQAALNRYCFGCHNEKTKTAGLSLEGMRLDNVTTHAGRWEKVLRKLNARYMPPPNAPRPDETTYQTLIGTVEKALDQAAAANPNPGRTDTFRRMNRTEYRNAVRDLLAIDVDVTALLPSDESGHGFDNVTVADLSPTLLERYLLAAQKISRKALGRPVPSPGGDTINIPPDVTQEDHFDGLPFGTRGGITVPYTFPLDATYEIVLRLARDRNEHVEGLRGTHQVELMVDGQRVEAFTVKSTESKDHTLVDQHLRKRLALKAGPHHIGVAFPRNRAALLETERQPYNAHFNMDRHPRITPALYSLTINGPYDAQGPGDSPSRRRILTCRPATPAEQEPCATRILTTLARRAYRRPVTPRDLEAPLRFYREGAKDGGFEAGVEMGLRAVLVSPEFLFRVEQDPPKLAVQAAYRISDLELASRLSFFLWSSIPDDELLDAAIKGQLRTPGMLARQTRRMLADPRSAAMVNNFAEQWLYLRNLSSSTPDMRVFADFDDNLRQSFRKETELFFESIMREDRNVLDLLKANYTFVNERLAKHYGLPNIYGSRFRRVTFDGESQRGGLLRHGSVLTVTSYATRTSPVIRGKWILDNLLGVPPPPPPPNVPALKESTSIGKSLTMRERMAEHRRNPVCAACHQIMDPVGFAMENFDAIGRYRTAEDGKPIDSAGAMPDGSSFEGIAGLEKAILARPEMFVTTVTEKLLTYALGRGMDSPDGPAVRQIVRQAKPSNFRFSSIILGIVESTPFQMRRMP